MYSNLTLFLVSVFMLTANVNAGEIVDSDQPRADSPESESTSKIGPCVLSARNLFVRVTPGHEEMPVIPLEEALNDPSCSKRRDYTDVNIAYSLGTQQAAQEERRIVPSTGAVFTRDHSNSKLGLAYRDPSGLIWGSPSSVFMTQYDGKELCESIGARLPTREEFQSLAVYLGRDSSQGFSPFLADGKTEVLPGTVRKWFWSSSVIAIDSDQHDDAYTFYGEDGDLGHTYRGGNEAIRCVVKRSIGRTKLGT